MSEHLDSLGDLPLDAPHKDPKGLVMTEKGRGVN